MVKYIATVLKSYTDYTFFFIKSQFISNLALDSLEFEKLLELQGKELKKYGNGEGILSNSCLCIFPVAGVVLGESQKMSPLHQHVLGPV